MRVRILHNVPREFKDRPRICVSRVARTIAGLAKADDMGETHVAEAIQYRSLDVQGV